MTENNTTFKSTTNETVRAPVRLEVGAVSTSVEITADAAGVEIEFGSVQGGGTNRQLVESIPNM